PSAGAAESMFNAADGVAGGVWAVGRAVYPPLDSGGLWRPIIAHRGPSGWRLVKVPVPSDVDLSELTGVAAANKHDIWAGGILLRTSHGGSALLEHWDGQRWRRSSGAPFGRHKLLAVTHVPGTDTFWAVGGYADDSNSGFYDGTSWH